MRYNLSAINSNFFFKYHYKVEEIRQIAQSLKSKLLRAEEIFYTKKEKRNIEENYDKL